MLKETPKSLRTYLGIVSALYFIMWAGAVSQIILLLHDKPGAHLSPVFLLQAAFMVAIAVAYAWITVKFNTLITDNPAMMKAVLHINLAGSVLFAVVYMLLGLRPNLFGLLISVLIYVYLLKSVDRISNDLKKPISA